MTNELLQLWAHSFDNNHSVAIEDANGNNLTYHQLYNQAKTIAGYIAKHYKDISFIPIQADNNLESYALIFGTWMANKAYVPITSDTPPQRIQHILNTINSFQILTWEDAKNADAIANLHDNQNQYAYVIFTSGSTGVPKAVPISWENLMAFHQYYQSHTEIYWENNMHWLQTYSLNFDVSLFVFTQCFSSLGKLFLLPNEGVKYLKIAQYIQQKNIEVCSNVPSTAQLLSNYVNELNFTSLKYCFFSGEALYAQTAKTWQKMAPNAQIYNAYGPTETTIVCSQINLKNIPIKYWEDGTILPIGIPFNKTKFKIIQDVLWVSGKQVFNGYLPENNEVFLDIDGTKFYSTGDVVAEENGMYIFKGRVDYQVQHLGYRIELNEIQKVFYQLFTIPNVVIYHENQLYLFYESDKEININYLQNYLPQYMLPHHYLKVEKLPLNNNQKINYQTLKSWINFMGINSFESIRES
jgi:D-alanine--poly(phosphoribitol) ligase subunit 1